MTHPDGTPTGHDGYTPDGSTGSNNSEPRYAEQASPYGAPPVPGQQPAAESPYGQPYGSGSSESYPPAAPDYSGQPPHYPPYAQPAPGQGFAGQPYSGQPYPGAPGNPAAADKSGGQLVWLIGLVSLFGVIFLSPIMSLIATIIVWATVRNRGPLSAGNARNAVNWQITYALTQFVLFVLHYLLLATVSSEGFIAPPLFTLLAIILLNIVNLVAIIAGSVKSSRGEVYRFPLAVPFHILTQKID